MIVRRLVHAMGFRFRLHSRQLPGKPDLVLPRHKKVIFVHGCYWHRHRCRYGRVTPKTNCEFWQAKFDANVARDRRIRREIIQSGWKVLTVWECWTKREDDRLISSLRQFLETA